MCKRFTCQRTYVHTTAHMHMCTQTHTDHHMGHTQTHIHMYVHTQERMYAHEKVNRQTNRQNKRMDRLTDRQTDRQTNKNSNAETNELTDTRTDERVHVHLSLWDKGLEQGNDLLGAAVFSHGQALAAQLVHQVAKCTRHVKTQQLQRRCAHYS